MPVLVVERPAAFHSEVLGHRNLHALYVIAVPEGLHEGIGEAENHQVVHRPLAQIVVDPEDVLFLEIPEYHLIEMPRRSQVMAEGFLDDHPRVRHAAAMYQVVEHRFEHGRRNGQVMRRPARILEFSAESFESRRIVIVAVHIPQQRRESPERFWIRAAVLFQAVQRAGFKLIEVPTGLCHPDHRHVLQTSSFHHRQQCGEDLLVRQVAGSAEENECIRVIVHRLRHLFPFRGLLQMSPEFIPHGREELLRKIGLAAR